MSHTRSLPIVSIALALLLIATTSSSKTLAADDRPNILWISCEDISPHLGCYGEKLVHTPTLDGLAKRGVRYTHAFTTTPVCATNRSSIITGMYPSTLGSQYMRCSIKLPESIKCFSQYLREAGYYCTNHSKTDYNFAVPKGAWDNNGRKGHWRGRKKGQPFFAVFNYTNTHESKNWPRGSGHVNLTKDVTDAQRVDPAKVTLPPYYFDTPESRRDWANYLENITQLDYHVARRLKELEEDGLADSTIIVYWSDHGVGLPRGKRWIYDSGTRVPFIVYIPEKYRQKGQAGPGTVTDELVSFIDLAPTMLNLAGVKIPKHMQGRAFLGKNLTPKREYVFNVRDRMDERYDMIRAVRDKRYRYIRNYMPWKPYYQVLNYAERNETMKALRKRHAAGKLNPVQAKYFEPKAVEELYDTQADPHEVQNLVDSDKPEHRAALARLRKEHSKWRVETRDIGFFPEVEVARLEQKLGSRLAIMKQAGIAERIEEVRAYATDDLEGKPEPDDPVMKYWWLLRLSPEQRKKSEARIEELAKDKSPLVRIAAAEGLWRLGRSKEAVKVATAELSNNTAWIPSLAVILLDEMGDDARSALPEVRKLLKQKGGGKSGSYAARVAEHFVKKQNDSKP